ncbi:hypothetical protein HK102_011357, partial [Quaeritorhiza haematococci]
EEMLSKQAYAEIMMQYGNAILPANHPYSRFVRKVAERIIKVSGMNDLSWEVYVVNSPQRNAFVLPGGKIFVFTGILPIVGDEDGMAAVLGHEIAHQVARHSAEKLSYLKVLIFFQLVLSLFMDPRLIFNRVFLEFGLMMPFSRKMESEADYIGLKLMAQACYDPRVAITMWERMKLADKLGGGNANFEYLSTHPSHDTRIKKIQEWMPEAIETRDKSDCDQMASILDLFNRRQWASW